MHNNPVLITIANDMKALAEDRATNMGWGRSTESLLKCLHCTQGCHYNRFPKTRKEFWDDVRQLLIKHGVDPEPIWKNMEVALANKDWKTTIAFTQEEFFAWVQEQLNTRPDQP